MKNTILQGTPISPGFGSGKAFVLTSMNIAPQIKKMDKKGNVDDEHEKIKSALHQVSEDLYNDASKINEIIDESFAEIFHAQIQILKDPTLLQETRKELEKELFNAEHAVKKVFHQYEQKIMALDNHILKERGDDIADLSKRVLDKITGITVHALDDIPPDSVLVINKLLPSDAVLLSTKKIAALIVEVGGPASHAAILTREIGIPAISQVENVTDNIQSDNNVYVDGNLGKVFITPDESQIKEFERKKTIFINAFTKARKQCNEPAKTKNQIPVQISANIGDRNECELATKYGADAIGLYRLEKIYLSSKKVLTEEELIESIKTTLTPVKNMTINIRLLDTGGDKQIPFLNYPDELNPALGLRGIRFLLKYPDLLDMQLKAILKLSREFCIKILVPMITFVEDLKETKRALSRIAKELQIFPVPSIGAMIETPAAALCAAQIANHADFISIGTNDLTQYTMATGRENQLVFDYFEESHPAMVQLLKHIVKYAPEIPISICGELASHLESIPMLLKTGIRELSVAPLQIPMVKEIIRNTTIN